MRSGNAAAASHGPPRYHHSRSAATRAGRGAWRPEREANLFDGGAPFYGTYACADGRFLHITASDQHWAPLCRALGLPVDESLSTNAARLARREEVMAMLTAALARLTRAEAVAALDAADVPNGPVLSIDETLTDPHTLARGLVGHDLVDDGGEGAEEAVDQHANHLWLAGSFPEPIWFV